MASESEVGGSRLGDRNAQRRAGAAMALACHTIMVWSGFTPLDRAGDSCVGAAKAESPTTTSSNTHGKLQRHPSPYEPPAGWQEASDSEWSFRYSKHGKAAAITLCVHAQDDL